MHELTDRRTSAAGRDDIQGAETANDEGQLAPSPLASEERRWRFADCSLPHKWKIVLKLLTALVVIPCILTIVGVIMEAVVYGRQNAPRFHYQYLCFAGWIASPFVLIRWFWPWPKHLERLGLVFYVIFSVGFFVTVYETTISGQTQFHMTDQVRNTFTSSSYSVLTWKKDIYRWLNFIVTTAYSSEKWDKTGRTLPGQLALFGRMRLSQCRSKIAECSSSLPNSTVFSPCYQDFSRSQEETANFSALNFTFRNPSYKNYAGDNIVSNNIETRGLLRSYPVAGYWVILSPVMSKAEALEMMGALEKAEWIDHQTRQVSLDFVVVAKDLHRPVAANVVIMIEVTSSGKYIPVTPILSFSYFEYIVDMGPDSDGNNKCKRVSTQKNYFLPIYFGLVPYIVFLLFTHLLKLHNNWRSYLKSMYTYNELLWVAVAMLAIIFRWRSLYYAHCSPYRYDQPMWPNETTRSVYNFEFLPMAMNWELARQMLAIAVFLQFISGLRYISSDMALPIPLDTLVNVINGALPKLLSFACTFFLIFAGFVLMFYLLFSGEDKKYQSIPHSISTLWLGLLGEMEFSEGLWRLKHVALPAVIFFTFVSVFVILTIIIAIISEAYEHHLEKRVKGKAVKTGADDNDGTETAGGHSAVPRCSSRESSLFAGPDPDENNQP